MYTFNTGAIFPPGHPYIEMYSLIVYFGTFSTSALRKLLFGWCLPLPQTHNSNLHQHFLINVC